MAPKPRKRVAEAEDYDTNDGFVVSENDSDGPRSKKPKITKAAVNERKKREGKQPVQLGMQKDDEGNPYWEISKMRRVTVSKFKGKAMVGIREFYEKDGKALPGKKGISLAVDQFAAFISLLPDIEGALKDQGETLPRPKYDKAGTPKDAQEDGGGEEEELSKDAKQNFEATSDEEE